MGGGQMLISTFYMVSAMLIFQYSRPLPSKHSGQANTPFSWALLSGPKQFTCEILFKTLPWVRLSAQGGVFKQDYTGKMLGTGQ